MELIEIILAVLGVIALAAIVWFTDNYKDDYWEDR